MLRTLDGAPDVAPDCRPLTLRLRHDPYEIYNHLSARSPGRQHAAPTLRADPRPLRPAASAEWLGERFTLTLSRRRKWITY